MDASWDEMDISDGSDANLSDVNDRPSPREIEAKREWQVERAGESC